METRRLGNTGLFVTALGYGAMELSRLKEKEAVHLLNAVIDSGINYIDTSPDYGPSEEYIGKAISHRRSEFYLATKCGCNPEWGIKPDTPSHIWDRKMLSYNIDNSLKKLKTDYIDVWQLHGTLLEELPGERDGEVIETMLEIKQQGKVRYIGISFREGSPSEEGYPTAYGFQCIQEFVKWDVFDVMQIVYGGLTRTNEIVIDKAANKGIGMVIRGVVKKYRENYPELFEKAELDKLCESNESMNSFLIRFALCHPGISTIIIGTKSIIHLKENIKATTKSKLSDEICREAKRRLDAIGMITEEI